MIFSFLLSGLEFYISSHARLFFAYFQIKLGKTARARYWNVLTRRDLFENDRYLIQVAFIHPFVEKQILGGDSSSLRHIEGMSVGHRI